jgi:hypothetical protein
MKINDILTIDLTEDIKSVINLEDVSESEIMSEIENYIVTDGLAKEYADFVSAFTSNIAETGVWISGFYGSGKSYFGKMLGYMLCNRMIAGTRSRDRILQRFTGINDEALIRNVISRLNTIKCRVVFLNIASQNTSKGLAFTLFRNFLKSLELPENEHGFLLYQLMIKNKQLNIYDYINNAIGKNWGVLKTKMIEYANLVKQIYIQKGNSESDYNNLFTSILRDIDQFSASRLKEELSNYLEINKDEKIVFIFDEASEAILQKKYGLLDLEGISESLSILGGKVWTIAIAQERLDDVINNSNVDKAKLTKVTDRFKTKIHLESTEVDIIIRSRLLSKKENAQRSLADNYMKNSGKIADHTALNAASIVKTDSVNKYVTYYPFYKYQFDLMQNFLFGTKGLTSTKVAARGMIITTYDILKRELHDEELFSIVAGWQISRQADTQPLVSLVNRYDNAERILKNNHSPIPGRLLLETIHFLAGSNVHVTLPNITKSFIKNPEDYHKVHDHIEKALKELIEERIVLYSNNTYRITSDIEQRLLDEMKGFNVQGFVKKKRIIEAYKVSYFVKSLVRITDNNMPYDFYITTDNDEELNSHVQKHMKIKIKSLYTISDNRTADIDTIRIQYQNDKDTIWLVPDNSRFSEIDKLIDEIERISYLEDKYKDPQSEEGKILSSFSSVKAQKENDLKDLVEKSLQNALSIYLYEVFQLSKDNWQIVMQDIQKKTAQNIYEKRLSSKLSDDIAGKVIKEANDARLHTYFDADDFKFFNKSGIFIGDNLKVTEELLFRIRNTFIDGVTLENDLLQPPTGFAFGTVISAMAALMRAGKVIAKYNGSEKFSWRDEGVSTIFSKANEFRKAGFKAVSKSLSAQQKNEIVNTLRNLQFEKYIHDRKIDWNTNDFDLVNAIKEFAKEFYNKVIYMQNHNKDFDVFFHELETKKELLDNFTGVVSESNYIEKAESFLSNKEDYLNAVHDIEKSDIFIRNNLENLRYMNEFVSGVCDELKKAAIVNDSLDELSIQFKNLYGKEAIKNYSIMQGIAQKIKDEYFKLMKTAAQSMTEKYTRLKDNAVSIVEEIGKLPAGLNDEALKRSKEIIQYANQRVLDRVEIDYDVKDKSSRFTYSEILSSVELFNSKTTDLDILKAGLVRELPPEYETGNSDKPTAIKNISRVLPDRKIKVSEYRKWLQHELKTLAGLRDDDEIEFKKGQ